MKKVPFSHILERWHKSKDHKTLASLNKIVAEKSFAIIIMLLMAIPALPLPTGGITHVFEIITMMLAVELMIGRRIVWLPKKWQQLKISGTAHQKLIPALTKRIQWFERFSKPRLANLLEDPKFLRVTGLLIFVLTLGAFLAPPFTGLDTLSAMGVVIICLSLILEDALILVLGLLVGVLGIAVEIGLGKAIILLVRNLF